MIRMLSTSYKVLVYYGTLLLFGGFGLLLNGVCLLIGWLPRAPARERFFQRVIHRHFAAFVRWLEFTRVVRVEYRGLASQPRGPRRLVLVANHPGLMDVTYLLARVPEAMCIFKSDVRRNPVLGAAARAAGYLANDGGVNLLRVASEKVADGATLIVFPEGTRTPTGQPLGNFRRGFALIARQADALVQLVRITCDAPVLAKGHAWWKLPPLPMRVVVQTGPCLRADAAPSSAALAAEVEAWFREPVSRSAAFATSAETFTA
jgi:1-acyl-sn-glycerol-3-phosphate acyltransferase